MWFGVWVECEQITQITKSPSVSFHGANWTDMSNLRLCIILSGIINTNNAKQSIRPFSIKFL